MRVGLNFLLMNIIMIYGFKDGGQQSTGEGIVPLIKLVKSLESVSCHFKGCM